MKYCILRSARVKTEANTHTFLDWMIQIYYIEIYMQVQQNCIISLPIYSQFHLQ